jgi:hypothetical protein
MRLSQSCMATGNRGTIGRRIIVTEIPLALHRFRYFAAPRLIARWKRMVGAVILPVRFSRHMSLHLGGLQRADRAGRSACRSTSSRQDAPLSRSLLALAWAGASTTDGIAQEGYGGLRPTRTYL